METLFSLQRLGLEIVDSQPIMLAARAHKTPDEIALLEHAAAIVDAVYEDIYRMLRPGVREHEVVAMAMQRLFELGSEQVEAINAVSGDRCNPHPHVFSDRLLRPGDQAFFDVIHSFMGYRTCYYRTFNVGGVTQSQLDAYKQCREWLDMSIELVKPGITTDRIAAVWPTRRGARLPGRAGLLRPAVRPRPRRQPLRGADDLARALARPPDHDRARAWSSRSRRTARRATATSAARIEEEVVVTEDGNRIITKFPAEELLVCGKTYVRGADLAARERGGCLMEAATAGAARADRRRRRADARRSTAACA